jgi:hypothetical protein
MAITGNKRGRRKGSQTRFKGVGLEARLLGVSSIHLWKVLTGKRQSETLTMRYAKLKQEKAKA